MANYYNEIDAYAAEWLRNHIKEGLIPDGEVDTRSIVDVEPRDLAGFTQCHFFAGIAGWSHALRLAQWPDDKPIWTGSCPCQPFSVAGKGKGKDDDRHLWPVFFQLISKCRPPIVMGEQVAGKAGYDWFDGVASDLEGEGYACRAVDIPACAVDAPHIRQRLYWVGVDNSASARQSSARRWQSEQPKSGERLPRVGCVGNDGDMADADDAGSQRHWRFVEQHDQSRWAKSNGRSTATGLGHWSDAEWRTGADGKTRRAKPGVRLLVDGVPNRVGRLRAYGNAIVPPLAAEVIKAFINA